MPGLSNLNWNQKGGVKVSGHSDSHNEKAAILVQTENELTFVSEPGGMWSKLSIK